MSVLCAAARYYYWDDVTIPFVLPPDYWSHIEQVASDVLHHGSEMYCTNSVFESLSKNYSSVVNFHTTSEE